MQSCVRSVSAVGLFLVFLASWGSSQGVRVNGPLAPVPGFGAEDVLGFLISPDAGWVVFFADAELGENRFELFSAPIDGSASSRRLNGPLVDGGNLAQVFEGPDGGYYIPPPHLAISVTNRVVYRGDQDVDEVQELYSAPIDGSAAPVKLSGTMVAGGDVSEPFSIAPDGLHVLFLADRETDGVRELWSVPIDGSTAPVRLNATPLPGAGFPETFTFPAAVAPDGFTVVFRLDQAAAGVQELWSVPIDASASPVRLNGAMVAGGDVSDFRIFPDGTHVLYRADEETNDRHELWRVPIDGSTPPVRVNGPLLASVTSAFSISPDGARAVYYAVQEGDSYPQHYSATLTGTPQSVALYARTAPDLGIFHAQVSPDGSRVVLWGDYAEDEVYEVFAVPIDGSASPLVLNGSLVTGGDVGSQVGANSFRISPDGSRVVYWADQVTVNVMELWSVPIDRSAEPVRISGDLQPGGNVVFPSLFSANGLRVVYLANQRAGHGIELWSAPSQGGAPPVRLSGLLVHGGNVQLEGTSVLRTGFDVSSDSVHVVYRADQRSNELFTLWGRPLDLTRPPGELNAPLDPGPVLGDVTAFAWTPDATRLLYAADQREDDLFEIHAAEPDPLFRAPIPNIALGEGRVMAVSPDSSWVAFRAKPTCDTPPYCAPSARLLGAPVDGSLAPVRCNPGLAGYSASFTFNAGGTHVVFSQVASGFRYSYGGIFSFGMGGGTEAVSLTAPAGMVPTDIAHFSRYVLSPDGAHLVYRRFQYDEISLWSVPVVRSSPPVLIAGLFAPQSILDSFQISPDGAWVVFVADLDAVGIYELYRVPLGGGSPPERLGTPMLSFADVDAAFRIHPDGTDVLFVADFEQDDVFELWSMPLDPAQGTVPLRLSAKPVPGGGVALGGQFELSLAADRVVYRSDERVPGQIELFSAPLDAGTAPVRLSPDLAAGEEVPPSGFRLDPLGAYVVLAAPDGDGVLRLHSARIDGGGGLATPLGGPFVPGGGLWSHSHVGVRFSFELAPDGATVVYLADQLEDEVFDLFAVPTDGSRPARRLNRRLVSGGDVRLPGVQQPQAAFAISPDGRLVAYLADQHTDEVFELFVSALEPRLVRPSDPPRAPVRRLTRPLRDFGRARP